MRIAKGRVDALRGTQTSAGQSSFVQETESPVQAAGTLHYMSP